MIAATTPRGLALDVPEDTAEGPSPGFTVADLAAAKAYYDENGYVVIRGLIPQAACERVRQLWETEVKPFEGFMYRYAAAKVGRHVRNDSGWVTNAILNPQSVDPRRFPGFRNAVTTTILTDPALANTFEAMLGATPTVIQSMYFEANLATPEHQDSYYLDSEAPGEMCGAWIALENIGPRAGRFFVCPGSHRVRLPPEALANLAAGDDEAYFVSVVQEIRRRKLETRAPAMETGDVLLWNALTIHGALQSLDPGKSRSSITCHAVPSTRSLLQMQTRLIEIKPDLVNGVAIHRHKDLALLRNRLVFAVETRFPSLFYFVKQTVIRQILRVKLRKDAAKAFS